MRNTKEYHSWVAMKQRCSEGKTCSINYWDRGIRVCQQWEDSFEAFHRDMGNAPSPWHSIDRINNDGDYTPENCRWATPKEQLNNTRVTVVLDYDGKKKTLTEWSSITGFKKTTIQMRLARGWSVKDALTKPLAC